MTIQPRSGEGVTVTTIRLPVDLRNEVKNQAIRMGRSLNTHVVMILKEATGAVVGAETPAAMKVHGDTSEASSHAAE